MFGVRQRLELACTAGVPFTKGFFLHGFFKNAREKLGLRAKNFGFQPGFLAGFLNRGKVDVRRQILFADVRQNIIRYMMPKISAQRAVGASGQKLFSGGEAVINRHQFAAGQTFSGLTPPSFRGR